MKPNMPTRKHRLLWCMTALLLMCGEELPASLDHIYPCDCSAPSLPSDAEWDGEAYLIREIYDSDMELVSYGEELYSDSVPEWLCDQPRVYLHWNGYTHTGAPARPGRYIEKVTISAPCWREFECRELCIVD